LASLIDVQHKTEHIFREYAHDLKYVGSVGVQDRLAPGAISTIEVLRKAGVKVCIASGDNMEACMSAAFNCKLASSEKEIV
jgi:P-type E1-E2 ATPase